MVAFNHQQEQLLPQNIDYLSVSIQRVLNQSYLLNLLYKIKFFCPGLENDLVCPLYGDLELPFVPLTYTVLGAVGGGGAGQDEQQSRLEAAVHAASVHPVDEEAQSLVPPLPH